MATAQPAPARAARAAAAWHVIRSFSPVVWFRTDLRAPFEATLLGACARVDRFMLEHSIRRRPVLPAAGLRERLARAGDFYGDPRLLDTFFVPPQPLRAAPRRLVPLPGGELVQLDYETDFTPVFPDARTDPLEAGNRRGVAYWWRHGDAGRPVMLCVHGYKGGQLWLEPLAFQTARFFRAGIDVLLYVLPYHGARSPAGSRHSGEAFFDMDLARTNEAFARAVYELRALLGYVRDGGASSVGVFGMSLGGYVAALLASVEPRLAFAVPMIPVISFPDRWWAEGEHDRWLALAIAHGWTPEGVRRVMAVHEPLSRPALVPHARRLIIGARADGICTPAHAEALWRHWQRPRIHWYAGGHLVQLGRGAALREIRHLLEDEGLLRRAPRRRARRLASRPLAAAPPPC